MLLKSARLTLAVLDMMVDSAWIKVSVIVCSNRSYLSLRTMIVVDVRLFSCWNVVLSDWVFAGSISERATLAGSK